MLLALRPNTTLSNISETKLSQARQTYLCILSPLLIWCRMRNCLITQPSLSVAPSDLQNILFHFKNIRRVLFSFFVFDLQNAFCVQNIRRVFFSFVVFGLGNSFFLHFQICCREKLRFFRKWLRALTSAGGQKLEIRKRKKKRVYTSSGKCSEHWLQQKAGWPTSLLFQIESCTN